MCIQFPSACTDFPHICACSQRNQNTKKKSTHSRADLARKWPKDTKQFRFHALRCFSSEEEITSVFSFPLKPCFVHTARALARCAITPGWLFQDRPDRRETLLYTKKNQQQKIHIFYLYTKKKMFFHFTHTHTVHARWIIWTHAASMLWRSNFFLAAKLAKTAQTCVNIFIISHQCRCKWVQRLSLVWRELNLWHA